MRWPAILSPKSETALRSMLLVLAMTLGHEFIACSVEMPRVAQEYDLKAAFLFNLAKFVRWPAFKFEREDTPLLIGVRGDEAFECFGRVLKDKTIDKHKVLVRRLAGPDDVKICHVVFISRSDKEQEAPCTAAAKDAAVLMVGETERFLNVGGMIQFSTESEQLRLEINEQRVRQAGMNIMANALSALVNKGIAKIKNN